MNMRVPRPLIILAAASFPTVLLSQEPAPPMQLRVNALEFSVGGRLQTQFNTTSEEGVPPSELFIRRARIEIGVRVNDRVTGVLHPDFGNDDVELKDAYLRYDFSPGVQFLAGKAYRPFGLLEQTSSKRMLMVERGLRIRGLRAADEYALLSGLGYSNRDVGLQLLGAPRGAPARLAYAAGLFRGPLHGEVGEQDSYQFAARVTAQPAGRVRVGAGWSSRDFAESTDVVTPDLRRGHAFEVDLEVGSFAPGFHLLAEVARGDHDPFTGADFWGAQTWLAYRTGEIARTGAALEPVFRASYADTESTPDGAIRPGGTLLTPGLNVYVGPLNRVMVNYDIWRGGDQSGDAQSLKVMFQLAF